MGGLGHRDEAGDHSRCYTVSTGRRHTQRVYTGRVISVDQDTVQFPDGSEGTLEMVRHPGASAVLPFLTDPDGTDPQVLLLRQYRYAAGDFIYEIPAGRLDHGEDPEACARRELLEEAGCVADRLTRVTGFYTTPGFTDEYIHAFMASGITRGHSAREPDEFIVVEAHPLSRVLQMIEGGQIVDGKTIITILFVAGFRLSR